MVWPDTVASVPFATLGAEIAVLPKPLLRLVKEATSNDQVMSGIRRGHAEPHISSGAALAVANLFDALDVLETAPSWQAAAAATSIPQSHLPLTTILSALQVPQSRATAIQVGNEPLALDEAERLATAAKISVSEVLERTAPLPDDLRRELQEPRWRPHVHERTTNGDEDYARTLLGHEAYQYRAQKTEYEQWRHCIEHVLTRSLR
ncbi:hypothetical protein CH295_27050 [Rhodococcus sp. 14-2483-1-2]|nr:hypothetical protein CH295_27050 [Rhodococcus sp. 14-2483-1-2]